MASPYVYPSEPEASTSSDDPQLSDHFSVPQNPEYTPTPGIRLPMFGNSYNLHKFPQFSPLDDDLHFQRVHVHPGSSASPVCAQIFFGSSLSQKKQLPTSFYPHQILQTTPMSPPANNLNENYSKMRAERDHWHTKYTELK